MKVYCKDCEYIHDDVNDNGDQYIGCMNKNNIKETLCDNWFDKYVYKICVQQPKKINKNNDCKWYKKKDNK